MIVSPDLCSLFESALPVVGKGSQGRSRRQRASHSEIEREKRKRGREKEREKKEGKGEKRKRGREIKKIKLCFTRSSLQHTVCIREQKLCILEL